MRNVLLGLVVLFGCGEPTLSITFDVPDPYNDEVNAVELRIHEPPAGSSFDCDDLAFGTADPDAVRVSLISHLIVRSADDVPIGELNRGAQKIFLARGLMKDDTPIAVGCASVGDVDQDTEVQIRAAPSTRMIRTSTVTLSRTVGSGFPTEPITFEVRDRLGNELSGIEARWQIRGLGETVSSDRVITDENGDASFLPPLPTRSGPFELDVRVRWAEGEPSKWSGLMKPPPEVIQLPGNVYDYVPGNIGPSAEKGFVALLSPSFGSLAVAFVYRSANGQLVTTVSQPMTSIFGVIDVVDDPAQTRDRVIVVTARDWYEVPPDVNPVRRTYPTDRGTPLSIHRAGDCNDERPSVFINYEDLSVRVYDLEATTLYTFQSQFEILETGCVSDSAGNLNRALVIDAGVDVGLSIAMEIQEDIYVTRPWIAVPVAMSFTPRVPNRIGPKLLLGTQVNVNEFVISRLRINPDQSNRTFELAMEVTDAPPQVPFWTYGGDIDGDDQLDVVSLFSRPTTEQSDPVQYAIWAVVGEERFAGDVDVGPLNIASPKLLLTDFGSDGKDEIIIGERTALSSGSSQARVEIYSMER